MAQAVRIQNPGVGAYAKFKAPPNFIQTEEQLKEILPTAKEASSRVMDQIDVMINSSNDEAQRWAYSTLKANMNIERIEGEINEDFALEFIKWLLGKSKYNYPEETEKRGPAPNGKGKGFLFKKAPTNRTPWGNEPLTYLPDVRQFLDGFVDQRTDAMKYISKLKLRGPKNLNDCLFWFKYITLEQGVDRGIINYARWLEAYDFLPPEKIPLNPIAMGLGKLPEISSYPYFETDPLTGEERYVGDSSETQKYQWERRTDENGKAYDVAVNVDEGMIPFDVAGNADIPPYSPAYFNSLKSWTTKVFGDALTNSDKYTNLPHVIVSMLQHNEWYLDQEQLREIDNHFYGIISNSKHLNDEEKDELREALGYSNSNVGLQQHEIDYLFDSLIKNFKGFTGTRKQKERTIFTQMQKNADDRLTRKAIEKKGEEIILYNKREPPIPSKSRPQVYAGRERTGKSSQIINKRVSELFEVYSEFPTEKVEVKENKEERKRPFLDNNRSKKTVFSQTRTTGGTSSIIEYNQEAAEALENAGFDELDLDTSDWFDFTTLPDTTPAPAPASGGGPRHDVQYLKDIITKANLLIDEATLQMNRDNRLFSELDQHKNAKPLKQSNIDYYSETAQILTELTEQFTNANVENHAKASLYEERGDMYMALDRIARHKSQLATMKFDVTGQFKRELERTGKGTSLLDERLWNESDAKNYVKRMESLFDFNAKEKEGVEGMKQAYLQNKENPYIQKLQLYYDTRNLISGQGNSPMERVSEMGADLQEMAEKIKDFHGSHQNLAHLFHKLGITEAEATLMHNEALMSTLDDIDNADYDEDRANTFDSEVQRKTLAMMVEFKRQKVIMAEMKKQIDKVKEAVANNGNDWDQLRVLDKATNGKLAEKFGSEIESLKDLDMVDDKLGRMIEDEAYKAKTHLGSIEEKRRGIMNEIHDMYNVFDFVYSAATTNHYRLSGDIDALEREPDSMEVEGQKSKQQRLHEMKKSEMLMKETIYFTQGLKLNAREYLKSLLTLETASLSQIQKMTAEKTHYTNTVGKMMQIMETINDIEHRIGLEEKKRFRTLHPKKRIAMIDKDDKIIDDATVWDKAFQRVFGQMKADIAYLHEKYNQTKKTEDELLGEELKIAANV